jgi:hypothetical protein
VRKRAGETPHRGDRGFRLITRSYVPRSQPRPVGDEGVHRPSNPSLPGRRLGLHASYDVHPNAPSVIHGWTNGLTRAVSAPAPYRRQRRSTSLISIAEGAQTAVIHRVDFQVDQIRRSSTEAEPIRRRRFAPRVIRPLRDGRGASSVAPPADPSQIAPLHRLPDCSLALCQATWRLENRDAPTRDRSTTGHVSEARARWPAIREALRLGRLR